MTWALVGVLVFVVIVALFGAFLTLQSISQTLANALSTLERVHKSDGHRIDTVLDRLMAMDFETFKGYQMAEDSEEGGIEFDEGELPEPFARVEVPGLTRDLGAEELRLAAQERTIMLEDFPEEVIR